MALYSQYLKIEGKAEPPDPRDRTIRLITSSGSAKSSRKDHPPNGLQNAINVTTSTLFEYGFNGLFKGPRELRRVVRAVSPSISHCNSNLRIVGYAGPNPPVSLRPDASAP